MSKSAGFTRQSIASPSGLELEVLLSLLTNVRVPTATLICQMSDSDPTNMSAQAFIDQVRKSGLVPSNVLDQAVNSLTAAEGADQIRGIELAAKFAETGLITGWQCGKLLCGIHRGFFVHRYRLLGHLGVGRASIACLAQNEDLKNLVSFKYFPQTFAQDKSLVTWWSGRTRTFAQAIDPRLSRVLDRGHDGSLYYVVRDFVEGINLGSLVRQFGKLPLKAAIVLVTHIGSAVDAAHRAGQVFGSLNSRNIVVNLNGQIRIISLGLPCVSSRPDVAAVGTTRTEWQCFTAPEINMHGADLTPVTDIYSIGCILGLLVTGLGPLPSPEETANLYLPFIPSSLGCLAEILKKSLKKNPAERYQSITELLAALLRVNP